MRNRLLSLSRAARETSGRLTHQNILFYNSGTGSSDQATGGFTSESAESREGIRERDTKSPEERSLFPH